jgi:hypothetical protein
MFIKHFEKDDKDDECTDEDEDSANYNLHESDDEESSCSDEEDSSNA